MLVTKRIEQQTEVRVGLVAPTEPRAVLEGGIETAESVATRADYAETKAAFDRRQEFLAGFKLHWLPPPGGVQVEIVADSIKLSKDAGNDAVDMSQLYDDRDEFLRANVTGWTATPEQLADFAPYWVDVEATRAAMAAEGVASVAWTPEAFVAICAASPEFVHAAWNAVAIPMATHKAKRKNA